MKKTSTNYTYSYTNNRPRYHHAYLVSPILEMLVALQGSGEKKLRVLDLGCGNGSLSHVIAEHGCEVVGADTSAPGIAISRQSFPECQFIQADIYELPDTDMLHSFDVVLAVEVIEHLLYPKELAKTAKKMSQARRQSHYFYPVSRLFKKPCVGYFRENGQTFYRALG